MAKNGKAESGQKTGARRNRKEAARKITAAGWGLFFIWLGLVLILKGGTGLVLLGVGVISLGSQVARRYHGLETEGFWVVVAVLLMIVGVWDILDARISLVAVFLIVVGLACLVSAVRGRKTTRDQD